MTAAKEERDIAVEGEQRERESSGIASMRESERESDNNINNKLTFF